MKNGLINKFTINPKDFGLKIHPFTSLIGGDPAYNASKLLSVLSGEKSAYRDSVILNSAAAIYISGKVRNLTNFGLFLELEEGIDGLVHVSDLSEDKKIKHPSEYIKLGENLDVVVMVMLGGLTS